jgi:hypothetical protein
MPKLLYQAIASLDGYVEDKEGNFDWAAPDREVHAFVNDLERPIGTYLYGRRMYETMVFWETVSTGTDQPAVSRDFAEIWRAAEKIVYSRDLETVSSARTRIERDLEPDSVRRLRRPPELTSRSGVPSSLARRSPWASSTSAIYSSGRSWSVLASGRCPMNSARSSNSSTSAGSQTASFIFDTACASDRDAHRLPDTERRRCG